MRLLLDTHILLWWLSASPRLSQPARKTIADSPDVYVSAATAWEIGIKTAMGKLEFPGDIDRQLAVNQFEALPVTVAHAVAAASLPPHHADPFDRMLVAQAKLESLTLVTRDRVLSRYDVRIMIV